MEYKPLPVGVDSFEMLITRGYYLIDKTLLIQELLDKKGSVNLFTRPRRFGKTLNMSMLRYFFEDSRDEKGERQDNTYLFDGLAILQKGERYLSHMGQYPVISLTLKSAKQPDFGLAYAMLKRQIAYEFKRHRYILQGESLADEKERYLSIMQERAGMEDYVDALQFLCQGLQRYHSRKVIILIDEYDVPLENAYMCGFYSEMVSFIRSLFESALKTNDSLEFAVITGCLRISKESIFTGLNNLNINSILKERYDEYFGFTDADVKKLCEDYGLAHKYPVFKEWYNGYLFGSANVYNPWSVIKFMDDLQDNPECYPEAYWVNTSSNSVVRKLIDLADADTKTEIEALIAGGTISKPLHEDITYDEVYKSMDNLWNFMFFTGYFRTRAVWVEKTTRQKWAELCIPNEEVKYIFRTKVLGWFDEKVKAYDRSRLFTALTSLNAEVFQEELTSLLQNTISFHDAYENFYHGFLAGVLTGMEGCSVKSNREGGSGRSDLFIRPVSRLKPAFVLEFKVAKKIRQLEEKADEALRQIEEKGYAKELEDADYAIVHRYGIAFCAKDCLIKLQQSS